MNKNNGIIFYAHCARCSIEHTDIKILHNLVNKELDRHCVEMSTIEWEDWFEIQVSGANSDFTDSKFSSLGGNIKVEISRLRKGFLDGKAVTLNCNNIVTPFPNPIKSDGAHYDNDRCHNWNDNSTYAYIPATIENKKSIDILLCEMSTLRVKMSNFLSQDNVINSLIGIDKTLKLM